MIKWHGKSVCLSVVCDVRAPYAGSLTFPGYFFHLIVAWPSGNSPTKITKIVQGDHPSERVKQEGGGQTGESDISPILLIYYTDVYIAGE